MGASRCLEAGPSGRQRLPGRSDRRAAGGVKEVAMLYWAVIFLVVAIIAGIFGFTGIAGTSIWIAKILFFVFIILFIISLLFGRRTPTPPV